MSGRTPDHRVRAAVTLQEWRALTFLHWPVDAALLRPRVPPELAVEEVDGTAWLAVTPFRMTGVRAPGLPVRLVRDFVEVNVRTYVRAPDGSDGVWFLSLDCPRPSVVVALRGLGLPYVPARTGGRREGATVTYSSHRASGEGRVAVTTRVGPPLRTPDPRTDVLTGRWNAYTRRLGALWRVPVEHEPWPLHEADADVDVDRLLRADGLPPAAGEPVAHFSPGVVDVRIGVPRPV